jgi:hypothetical protein
MVLQWVAFKILRMDRSGGSDDLEDQTPTITTPSTKTRSQGI